MILPAAIAHRAIRGDATHLRTIAHTDQAPWAPGQSIPIRTAARRPAIGRLIVIAATQQAIADITHTELRQEGWGGRNPLLAFARDWLHRHDRPYRPALPHATDDEILHRLRERHADRPTWRIAITPDPDQPRRLLAARSELGYTSSPHLALPDEPEAVDAHTQEAITRAARACSQQRQQHSSAILAHHVDELRRRTAQLRRAGGLTPQTLTALRQAEAQLRQAEAQLRRAEAQLRREEIA